MKVFVDTNVYIDLIGNREQFVHNARSLCVAAMFDDIELWVSTQTIADADYIFRAPGQREEARKKMAASLQLFNLCGVHAADAKQALSSGWPDLEDHIIAASAKRINADVLVTRDAQGFLRSEIEVLSPENFLSYLQEECGIQYEEMPW